MTLSMRTHVIHAHARYPCERTLVCVDFIVLDKNIFQTKPEDISDIHVMKTYFEGYMVYPVQGER